MISSRFGAVLLGLSFLHVRIYFTQKMSEQMFSLGISYISARNNQEHIWIILYNDGVGPW